MHSIGACHPFPRSFGVLLLFPPLSLTSGTVTRDVQAGLYLYSTTLSNHPSLRNVPTNNLGCSQPPTLPLRGVLIIKCPRARSATCARRPGTLPPSALHSIPDHRSISFFATSPKTTHSHTFHIFSTTNRRAGSADTPTSANSARTRTEPVARSGESPHQPTRKDLRPVLRPTTLQHVGCCKSITNQGTDVVLDGNLPASIFTHTGWGNRSGSNGCVGGRTSPAALCTLSCTHLTPSFA